jgi:membrane-associated phospholipid phosphatase
MEEGKSPIIRPIGVSPALKKLPNEDWFRGNKWPPADLEAPFADTTANSFPIWAWSAYHFSIVGLAEFVKIPGWDGFDLQAVSPIPTGPGLKAELEELQELMDYRQGVMAEALAQLNNLVVYWCGLLMFNKASHPATYRLSQIALRVAQFQAMHYKFNPGTPLAPLKPRPRASQLSPSLMPPIDVPGHASYPSGHATESYLLAGMLAQVMPAAASTETTPGDPDSPPLRRLAERVARNREVLGLHYPSDSKAGKYLGDQSLQLLLQCPSVVALLPVAKLEWN